MQEDPRTLSCALYALDAFSTNSRSDVFHVDCAKYTETPVSKLKPLLQYWYDKAFWHRPTICVLDNIDKLMGIEQEVRVAHLTNYDG